MANFLCGLVFFLNFVSVQCKLYHEFDYAHIVVNGL